jgi:hypothetical protein
MRARTIQTNFSSGELDPLMHFRSDTGAYQNGARRLRNAILFSSGGAARRPGTYNRATLPALCRILPFDFAPDERYVLAFSNGRLDYYDSDGQFLGNVTSGCNWTTATLFEFTFDQVADTMVVSHQSWRSQVISRVAIDDFDVTNFPFAQSSNGNKVYQPYYKFADDDVTLSCSGVTGSVTVTASAPTFVSSMVGERIRWHQVEIELTAYTSTTVMTGTIKGTLVGEYDNNPFRTSEGSTTVEVTHVLHGFTSAASVTIAGAGATGGIAAANLNGARTITVIDDNRYSFVAGAAATESIDGGGPSVTFSGAALPTRNWLEQVFSVSNGWPGAVAFHEGRLWFAGTPGLPDGLFSSRLFEYFAFEVGDGGTADSIQVTLGASQLANIRHLVSNNDLQIFTANAEAAARSPRDVALTPANIVIRQQTPYGAGYVRPYPFDGATLFVQASGSAVREFIFSEASQRYQSTDLNVLSSHLLDGPVSMDVLYGGAERNEQYAYIINSNASVALFYSARSEQLAGWTTWDQGGAGAVGFRDLCVLGEDIFAVSQRGAGFYLEKFSANRDMTIDGATTYNHASPQSAWVVGTRYRSQTVSVLCGTYYLGDFPVDASGNINVGADVTQITVGYNFTFSIKTLPVDLDLQTGSTVGLPKRIVRVFVGLDSALSLSISGNKLLLRQVADNVEDPSESFTGVYEFRLLGYQKDAFVELLQEEPLPVTVLGMNMEIQA